VSIIFSSVLSNWIGLQFVWVCGVSFPLSFGDITCWCQAGGMWPVFSIPVRYRACVSCVAGVLCVFVSNVSPSIPGTLLCCSFCIACVYSSVVMAVCRFWSWL